MLLAIFFLLFTTVITVWLEWTLCVKHLYRTHFYNVLQQVPYKNCTDKRVLILYSFTSHNCFEIFISVYWPQIHRGTSSFSPKYTLEEMERRQVNISPVHTMPADVLLKRAGDYNMARASNASLLPKVSDLYEISKWKQAKSFLAKGMPTFVETSEMAVGVLKGSGGARLKIPICRQHQEQIADTRLPESVRSKGDQIMVAAVEVINDGFASVNSDVTLAGAVYDKRHMTLQNSFKGAYAARAGGVPSHTVFYPTHRVPTSDNPNDTLELALVSRDSDFDEQFTLANVSVRTIYAKAKGPEAIHETRHLLSKRTEDVVKAQQFASENEVVLATPRLYPKINLDNYELPGSSNIQISRGVYERGGIQFPKPTFTSVGVVLNATKAAPVKIKTRADKSLSGFADSDDDEDIKHGQALMQEEVLEVATDMHPLQGIPETMRLLYSGVSTIALNVVPGTKIMKIYLNDLPKNHSGVHVQLLNMLAKIPGSLRIKIHCELAPTCGIGLAVSYVEGNESSQLGNDLGRLLGIQHKKWNPAIEPTIDFAFKPFSCCDWWNMHYLGSGVYAPVITVVCLSKWVNPPKLDCKMAYAIYFEPDLLLPKQIATLDSVPGFMLRKELGTLNFAQGERKAFAFEANIGKSQVDGKIVTHTFASAYCGLSQFVEMDVILDFTLMSSPMIGATFSVAYVAGSNHKQAIAMQILDSLPHANFTFKAGGRSTISVKFAKELFAVYQALDRWDMDHSKDDEITGRFVLYQRDTISSNMEGNLVMRISMRTQGEPVFHGVSVGYPTTTERVGKGKTLPRDFGTKPRVPVGVKIGQSGIQQQDFASAWYPCGYWSYQPEQHVGVMADGEISTEYLKMRLDGTKATTGFEVLHSAFTRLLQNCAWFSGTIEWCVVVQANSEIQAGKRTSQVHITAHESSLSSNEFYSTMLNGTSGVANFQRTVVGPIEGMRAMGWHVSGDKKFYKLCVKLGNVHEYSAVQVFGRFHSNVRFAGQQKGGTYTLSKEAVIFKSFTY